LGGRFRQDLEKGKGKFSISTPKKKEGKGIFSPLRKGAGQASKRFFYQGGEKGGHPLVEERSSRGALKGRRGKNCPIIFTGERKKEGRKKAPAPLKESQGAEQTK